MAFQASTLYQAWAKRLRFSWNAAKGQAILSSLAAVIGDKAIDWMIAALLDHLPEYGDATAVGLMASERQIDAGPAETTAALAARLTRYVQTWEGAGTPLGMLLALHYAGFPGAVSVQQNGQAYSLNQPIVVGNEGASLVITQLGPNPPISGIRPLTAGTVPWWTFDSTGLDANNDQWNSRFGVVFPASVSFLSTAGDRNRLRNVVAKWRPGRALFMGIWVLNSGRLWGWPTVKWGDAGLVWGGTFTFYSAALE